MRVAAIQFKARADFRAGLKVLASAVERAGQSVDLVVCPEMALRGYAFTARSQVLPLAEGPDGPTARALGEAARRAGAWVVCGLPERVGDRVFNAALVIDPSGAVVFTYRKTLLFEADVPWADPGDSGYRAFDADTGRFGVGICMDLNDDRFLGWCAGADLDVVALPTNWVQEEGSMWDYWASRLDRGWGPELEGFEGRVPGRGPVEAVLVGANSYGPEGAYVLRGASAMVTRREVLAAGPDRGDAVIPADLTPWSRRGRAGTEKRGPRPRE